MDGVKLGVLLLWALCGLSILGALLRFIWTASGPERLLVLGLCLLTAASLRRTNYK